MANSSSSKLWALVLAGGDGTRLQSLTRLIAGAPIPKQYCRLLGERSLLEETLARLSGLAPPSRTLAVVNRDHLPLAAPQLASLPRGNVVVQPRNRDTGPGLLLPLLELARRDPDATVAVFPSDHYLGNVPEFRARVREAAALVATHAEKIVLLGTDPEWGDPGYGYIVPGEPVPGALPGEAFAVRAFCEKPPPAIAERIVREGALWNCFVLVCRVERLLALARNLRPHDVARLAAAVGDGEARAAVYDDLPAWNFSHDVLSHLTPHLLVLRAADLSWSDWGTVAAIERTLASLGRTPPWRAASASLALDGVARGGQPTARPAPRPPAPAATTTALLTVGSSAA
jgi:mannose-1-phosphate guanylyltransferase